jgi:hypothetical protein
MEDKSFRPERRPINPQEIQAHLNQKTETHAAQDMPMPMQQLPEGAIRGVPPQFLKDNDTVPSVGELHARMSGASIDTKLQDVLMQIRQSTTNFEEITLPSLGKFYDGSIGPLDGKLHVRPMTGHEEEILATQRFVKKGQAVNMIFSRCLKEKFDSNKLLVADRTYLLLYLRGISYTPNYDVSLKCPECDHQFEETIDLDSLYLNFCPNNFGPTSLKDQLPTSGLIFSYRLPTGEDERKVQDYRDHKAKISKQFNTSERTDDSLLYRTAIMLNDISGIANTDEILEVIRNLQMNDVVYLRNLINSPPFGVDTNIAIHCPNCPAEFDVDLPIESNFFFPRAKPKTKEENQ